VKVAHPLMLRAHCRGQSASGVLFTRLQMIVIILFGDHELDTRDLQARTMAELRVQLRISTRPKRGPLPSTPQNIAAQPE